MSIKKSILQLLFCSFSLLILSGCQSERSHNQPSEATSSQEDLLKGIVTSLPPDTPETLAAKKAKLESNLTIAREAAAKGDLDQSISLLEESVGLDPQHREVLMLLIKTSQLRSRELRAEDPWRCYRLIVQAGGYIRTFREAHKELSTEERQLLANALFDEACAHARSKRQSEFSSALSAAIEAGFADTDRLESDPDLELFRKVPEMEALIRNATDSIAKPTPSQAR